MNNLNEAVQLLTDGGVIDRLKEESQDAREKERAELLARLVQIEHDEAVRNAAREEQRPALCQRVAELEDALNTARRKLGALDTFTPPTGDRLRGKLRKLSDARIADAINVLRVLDSKARNSFASAERRVKLLAGGYTTQTVSNALAIADVVARIKGLIHEFEALQESKRPDNLSAYLASRIDPIKIEVRKLHGFN